MIEARGLSKRFQDKKRGQIRAVDNVSFTCHPGKIYGLLGANGAGKTTTLRMLATILEPTDGTAIVCGHDVIEQPEKVRANVGFLSTATALYPRLTAQELVEYFGRLNGLDEATLKKRVDDIFNRLDMNGFRDRRCDKLSTGMKQKTSIARTLVHDPPVMIFDEPTIGLDVMTEALRDRRTLITMFIVPLVLFPLVSVGFGAAIAALIGKAKEETPQVMVIGGEDSPAVLAGLKRVPKIQIVPLESNWKEQVVNKQIPVVVEIPEGFERNLANQKEQTVLIHDYEGELKSETAKNKVEKYFNEYRDSVVKDRLAARSLPVSILKPFAIKPHNVA